MTPYKLELLINPKDLSALRESGRHIVIGKAITDMVPDLAWISFEPYEINDVQWSEEYGIYASLNKTLEPGAIVNIVSDLTDVETGIAYHFDQQSGSFTNSGKAIDPDLYEILSGEISSSQKELTFGLMLPAIVQGIDKKPSPVTASLLYSNMRESIKVSDITLYIWVTDAMENGEVINEPAENGTIVKFGNSNNISLQFDSHTGKFVTA